MFFMIYKSSIGFHSIGSLYKTKKYKLKKITISTLLHRHTLIFIPRSNSYNKLIEFCSEILSYSGLSLSRTRKGQMNLFEIERKLGWNQWKGTEKIVPDREKFQIEGIRNRERESTVHLFKKRVQRN